MLKRDDECHHLEFETRVAVGRLSETEGGPITGYAADIQIRCKACKQPFQFLGVSEGVSRTKPTGSALYREELRAPIAPAIPGAPSWEDNEAADTVLNRALGNPKKSSRLGAENVVKLKPRGSHD